MNIKGHFETITRHKLLVMKYCFACGLYEQGLAHDLSKYSPTEFIPGCIYYQGDHSPNEAERLARGYSSAWLPAGSIWATSTRTLPRANTTSAARPTTCFTRRPVPCWKSC